MKPSFSYSRHRHTFLRSADACGMAGTVESKDDRRGDDRAAQRARQLLHDRARAAGGHVAGVRRRRRDPGPPRRGEGALGRARGRRPAGALPPRDSRRRPAAASPHRPGAEHRARPAGCPSTRCRSSRGKACASGCAASACWTWKTAVADRARGGRRARVRARRGDRAPRHQAREHHAVARACAGHRLRRRPGADRAGRRDDHPRDRGDRDARLHEPRADRRRCRPRRAVGRLFTRLRAVRDVDRRAAVHRRQRAGGDDPPPHRAGAARQRAAGRRGGRRRRGDRPGAGARSRGSIPERRRVRDRAQRRVDGDVHRSAGAPARTIDRGAAVHEPQPRSRQRVLRRRPHRGDHHRPVARERPPRHLAQFVGALQGQRKDDRRHRARAQRPLSAAGHGATRRDVAARHRAPGRDRYRHPALGRAVHRHGRRGLRDRRADRPADRRGAGGAAESGRGSPAGCPHHPGRPGVRVVPARPAAQPAVLGLGAQPGDGAGRARHGDRRRARAAARAQRVAALEPAQHRGARSRGPARGVRVHRPRPRDRTRSRRGAGREGARSKFMRRRSTRRSCCACFTAPASRNGTRTRISGSR